MNILSFDIEDWFHPEIFAGKFPRDSWDQLEGRVKRNTEIILDFLSRKKLKATFFYLGWIGEKYPELVTQTVREGHEIASHGYAHVMLNKMNPEEFRTDLFRSLEVLNALSDHPVEGFRAPTFSITKETMWALPIMYEAGIRYDSSVFPIYHDRYGIPDAPRDPYLIFSKGEDGIWEYPLTTIQIGKVNFPFGGGGYFRLYPFSFSRYLMERCRREGKQIIFYAHPWEFDTNLPRVKLSWLGHIRHYTGIKKFLERIDRVTDMFPFTSFREALSTASHKTCDN